MLYTASWSTEAVDLLLEASWVVSGRPDGDGPWFPDGDGPWFPDGRRASFTGPDAEGRAKKYAAWKNQEQGKEKDNADDATA